jgi:hypothetical protein
MEWAKMTVTTKSGKKPDRRNAISLELGVKGLRDIITRASVQ